MIDINIQEKEFCYKMCYLVANDYKKNGKTL